MSDRDDEKNGQTRSPRYNAGDLVVMRFGRSGTQLAEVRDVSGQEALVRRWQNGPAKFTQARWVALRSIVGPAAKSDPRAVLARAKMKEET